MTASVDLVEALGSEVLAHFTVDAPPVVTEDTRDLASDRGDETLEALESQASRRRSPFVAKVDPEASVPVGGRTQLVVDTSKLHFFDPGTGDGVYEQASATEPVAVTR